MAINLIIFDLDGTLIDSIRDIADALNYALSRYGEDGISVEDVKTMVGEGTERLIEKALKRKGISVDMSLLIKDFRFYYENHLIDHTRAYPGVVETLEALKGIKKTIISNKYENLCIKALDGLNLLKYFDMVVCSDTIPEKKPSPKPVFHVLDSMKVKKEDALIVGDSLIDIITGKAASILTVAVTYGYGQKDFFKEAHYVIDNMSELIDVLETLKKKKEL
ncbi:MAG: HAD-IA family hydrolase [Syntrophorhabdaceae bacterium]|nr:HAD-IA family hydrolase [Syntrophorhabdaceae bacterium]